MIDLPLAAAADLSIRMTVVVAAVALVLTLFRVRSGGTRHTAWTAVLLVLLLLPVLSRMVPPVAVSMPRPVALVIQSIPTDWIASATVTSPVPSTPQTRTSAAPSADVTSQIAESLSAPSVPVKTFPWRTIVAAVYAASATFFLLRLCLGLVHVSRIRRNSRAIESTAGDGLFESSLVATPVTVGLFAPRVVLPCNWREWPAEMLAAVAAHERAHASRRDPLIAVLARLNCALYWFHPVVWWLERELRVTAEHRCDDAALEYVTPRQYVETLLEIAATVRRHQGRLVWRGVGVDGDGRLGRRIDRVLSAAAQPTLSPTRRVVVAVSSALAILAVIACRQVATPVEPLREDPQLAAELKQRKDRQEFYKNAERMTLDQAAALERLLEQNPEDMVTREKLIAFYHWTGNTHPQTWKDNVAARRRHELWLIEYHPDSELLTRVRVFKSEDPDGYGQARKLWLAAIARPDANARVLGNAAVFFQGSEKPLAEQMLLRARAQEPDAPPRVANGEYFPSWSWRLGVLYAYAIIGRSAQDPDARWATDRLKQSTDAQVLYAAGYDLSWRPAQAETKQFGAQLLERASRLDASIAERVRALSYRSEADRLQVFFASPRESWPALLEKATGVDRLRLLTALSDAEYLSAEYVDWLSRQAESVRRSANSGRSAEQDQQAAASMFARSKAYAREAIDVGESLDAATKYPDPLFRAHIAYGLHALREGKRTEAAKQLLEASSLSPAPFDDGQRFSSTPLEYRLVNYMLKNGERETVIEYLERGATHRWPARRDEMLRAAAAIRAGRMPEHYQRLLASGSL